MIDVTLIPLTDCCVQLGIEESFVFTLEERGLTHTIRESQTVFIDAHELGQLEKIVRLHKELSINLEGIEAIMHLLEQIDRLQSEISSLSNKLRLYE